MAGLGGILDWVGVMPRHNCEPYTPILTAWQWSRDFLTFALSGKGPKSFDLKVSDIKAQCHAILGNFQKQPRDQRKNNDIKYPLQPKIRRGWSQLKKME